MKTKNKTQKTKLTVTEQLSVKEQAQFDKLDGIIKQGAATFMEVGRALAEMHTGRLYRAKFATFEDYAASHGLKRRQAYDMVSAAKTALELEHSATVSQIEGVDAKKVIHSSSAKAISKIGKIKGKKKRENIAAALIKKSNGKGITRTQVDTEIATIEHRKKPGKAVSLEKQIADLEEKIASGPRGGNLADKRRMELQKLQDELAAQSAPASESHETVIIDAELLPTDEQLAAMTPVEAARACYKAHETSWAQHPLPTPLQIVDKICEWLAKAGK